MAPFKHHVTTTVLSTQVVSSDEKTILIEPGSFTPMRWFLEHHKLHSEDPKHTARPPKKRVKIEGGLRAQSGDDGVDAETDNYISLAQVTVDLQFPETLDAESQASDVEDVDFAGAPTVPVISYGVFQDDACLHLKLAHPTHKGAVIKIDAGALPSLVFDALRSLASPKGQVAASDDAGGRNRPASLFRSSLRRSVGKRPNVVRWEAAVLWRDGGSAFPAGVPVGSRQVYEDYDLYARFFPDERRREVDHTQTWTPRDFYESVHVPDKTLTPDLGLVTETELYPFQKRAVEWMMRREGVQYSVGQVTPIPHVDKESCNVAFYHKGHDAEGNQCYCNPVQGIITRNDPKLGTDCLSGGILAEEMGLGKTVEMMALLSLHRRSQIICGTVFDDYTGTKVRPSKATVIITPTSILQQWRSELSRHAPSLKVFHYEGLSSSHKRSLTETELVQKLSSDYDVVLATYQTLTKEVHFATDPPVRDMRHARRYARKRSPLIQIQWWRVCLDEAQLVESGVTNAARVACRLPRVHSWAVSGTPVKRNVQDLHGLLIFLLVKPFNETPKLWGHLVTNHRHIFREIFAAIALRHTKAQVRDELQLPPQSRVVITVPFTAIEQQHYATLFSEMCEDIGLQSDGSPKTDRWDPESPQIVEAMRTWLGRLRQTCLHPQVGGRNRRALGKGKAPLRRVEEVLESMIIQNENNTKVEERHALYSQIMHGHIAGNARDDEHRSEKALAIYRPAMERSAELVEDARQCLHSAKAAGLLVDVTVETDEEDSSSESTPLLGRLRTNLRTALGLQHACTYFAATAHYQIKINEALTMPGSDEFKKLEQQEVELYEKAKALRREILKDTSRKSERFMQNIKNLLEDRALTKMPAIKDLKGLGGIESRNIVHESDKLFDVIRQVAPIISGWRAAMIEILSKPLVDEDDEGKEITGDEYELSTKQQDELYVYFDALKALLADLTTFITGESTPLIDHEFRGLVKSAKKWLDPEVLAGMKEQPHAPELLLELASIREKFRSQKEELNSVRGLISDARRLQDLPGGGSARTAVEGTIATQHLHALQAVFTNYTKALAGLEKEISLFRTTQNQRLDFYRQLQEISDAVAPFKEQLDEQLDVAALNRAMQEEEQHNTALAQLKTKYRFLQHLKHETSAQDEAKICVICQCTFENGVLTVCGHQYCKACIQHWWTAHRTCPVCKRRLSLVDFHDITYKPRELRAQEEVHSGYNSPGDCSSNSSIPSQHTLIYTGADGKLMDQIKSIDLPSSYGTKIDTLARHLFWIREHDPGAKAVVFTQFREFLDVLSSALSEFKIGFSRLGKPGAVERFRYDPSVDCLLLDAKTDSSGLTLVNATHVFICEPLIQTAVELQAIARVHRIGQTRPTTVWMYLINDTVEESIYEISVTRRMAHVQSRVPSKTSEKSRSVTPSPAGEQALDVANSEELQSTALSKLLSSGKGGGELVGKDDVWQCLFGKASKSAATMDPDMQSEFDRNLRAQAAEHRAAPGMAYVEGGTRQQS